jgi:hypothetical protein
MEMCDAFDQFWREAEAIAECDITAPSAMKELAVSSAVDQHNGLWCCFRYGAYTREVDAAARHFLPDGVGGFIWSKNRSDTYRHVENAKSAARIGSTAADM